MSPLQPEVRASVRLGQFEEPGRGELGIARFNGGEEERPRAGAVKTSPDSAALSSEFGGLCESSAGFGSFCGPGTGVEGNSVETGVVVNGPRST